MLPANSKSSHFSATAVHPVIRAAQVAGGVTWSAPTAMLPFIWPYRAPSSVGEFGCGHASWLRGARELGAARVHGFDIPELDIADRHISADEFTAADLSKPLALTEKFDLAISTEVGEHLPIEAAPVFVRTLTSASDWVLFGSAAPFQGGMNHINENWLEFWAALFAKEGFLCYDIFRLRFWHDAAVPYYIRQNTCLYVKSGADKTLLEAGFQPTKNPPTLIHPEQYLKGLASKPVDVALAADSVKNLYKLIAEAKS